MLWLYFVLVLTFLMFFISTNLYKNNVNNEAYCTTKYGVCAILCWMAHTIMAAIASQGDLFSRQWVHYFGLITSPKWHDGWDEQMPLMVIVCGLTVDKHTHVPKYQQNFIYWGTSTEYCQAEKKVPSRKLSQEVWLALPKKCIWTTATGGLNRQHGACLGDTKGWIGWKA